MSDLPTPEVKPTKSFVNNLDQLTSINVFLDIQVAGEILKIQITSRHSATAEVIANDTDALIAALNIIRINHPKPELPSAAAPKPDPAVAIALKEDNKPMAKELQAQAEAIPNPPEGKTWLTFDAAIVKVLPQPDNKTTIEFYGASDKYPRVKVNKWKVEQADGLMKHVTSETMSKAAEYKLACRVYYTEGAEYHNERTGISGHYKDVSAVRPI